MLRAAARDTLARRSEVPVILGAMERGEWFLLAARLEGDDVGLGTYQIRINCRAEKSSYR